MLITDIKNYKQDTYGVIYKLTAPNGKYYIGQSTNFKLRMYYYKHVKCKRQQKLYNSLKKYGFDNFKIEIMFECDSKVELNIYESLLLPKETLGYTLNIRTGGGNYEPLGDAERITQSESTRGEKHYLYGKNHSDISKAKNRIKMSKAVIGTHKKTGEVVEYTSGIEAARILDIDQAHISQSCNSGGIKSHGGYYWVYKDGSTSNRGKKEKAIRGIGLINNDIKEYGSIKSATKDGFSTAHIGHCLSGVCKSHRGYRWEYQ